VLTTTMHHLSLCPRRGRPISRIVRGCQEPYLDSKMHEVGWKADVLARERVSGAAWLSSARVV